MGMYRQGKHFKYFFILNILKKKQHTQTNDDLHHRDYTYLNFRVNNII
jgi:hypothetical protein